MPQINIKIRNKIAETESDVAYVCGNSDFVIVFDFDDEWLDYDIKTARFKYNGTYQDIIFHGNQIDVPVIENTYKIYIGVYAGDLHTTTPAVLNAKKSILSGSGTPIIEQDDVYSQLMQELNDQIGLAEDSEKAAAQSAKDAADSAREADAAKQEVQAALDTKVDKVSGKGLSTNDYTTAEKNKLAGVEAGANKTVVDTSLSDTSTNPVQNKAVKSAIDDKADKTSVNELKSDLSDKLPKSPANWEQWTADEQAAARGRMSVENGSDFELLVDAVLDEEANTFLVQFPKPVRECIYHIWFYNNNDSNVVAQAKCLDSGTNKYYLLKYTSGITTGRGYALNGYFRYNGPIPSRSIIGYASDSSAPSWTTDLPGNGNVAYMAYPTDMILKKVDGLSFNLADTNHVLNVGATIKVWGR